MTIILRTATAADTDALMALFHAAVHGVASRDYSAAQVAAWAPDAPDRAAWTQRLSGGATVVAERAGAVAGFVVLAPGDHVDMLFVHPDHLRRGIASALLAEAEALARAAGARRLTTDASLTARPAFEHTGFRVVVRQTVRLRGQDFVNFRMEKPLA